jgi:hypothetical protein
LSLVGKNLNSKPEGADAHTLLEENQPHQLTGMTLDNGMHSFVQWLQGGDLKLHLEMCAQNGHASRNPGRLCEGEKCAQHLTKRELEVLPDPPIKRTIQRTYQLNHLRGKEYGLIERYQCP